MANDQDGGDEIESQQTSKPQGRFILAANRLPVTVKRKADGEYDFEPSSGGLAAGLAGVVKKVKLLWYGWPGMAIPPRDEEAIRRICQHQYRCTPIFLPQEVSEAHYNGFSNSILWPLVHYHPEGICFDESAWEGYSRANDIFANGIVADLRDNDIIWVQDYHLMLLPEMIRKAVAELDPVPKNIKIGFFLHTPFPSSDIFRVLPVREKLLQAVLHCDLVGFHTPDYARHFIDSCARVLNLPTTPSGVQFQGRFVKVKDCAIGIDPSDFYDRLQEDGVKQRIAQLKQRFDGVKVIVGVDRLDYIKGVQQKLHAMEVFLTEYPEWIGKVVLIQLAVPTRGDVEEYQNLRAVVNELVGRINGRFGTVDFTPIHFMHKSLPIEELTPLYAASDICLVTSTRDGMNLVSYEFIACQHANHGVLILSEFAGAAQNLAGALVINPWDTAEMVGAMREAVTMTKQKRDENFAKMARVVDKRTSENWGTTFVRDIIKMSQHGGSKLDVKGRDPDMMADGLSVRETVDSKLGSDVSYDEDEEASGPADEDDSDNGIMMKANSSPLPALDG